MRYRVWILDTTKSDKWDLIVRRFKQKAGSRDEAIAIVLAREYPHGLPDGYRVDGPTFS